MQVGIRSRPALALALAGALSACSAAESTPSPSASPAPHPTPEVSIRIGPDGPELPQDAAAELQAYGAAHPDEYGGIYVDDQGRGSFVMLFTDRLEEHAAAVAEIWPRVTVRGARFSEAALVEVLDSLHLGAMATEGIEPISAGLDTIGNRVFLELKSNDPTLELRLELEYGGMVEVTVHPLPGAWSNASEGDGWRLLAAGETAADDAYEVQAATDEAGWEALWSSLALAGDRPPVDFAAEVVVSFGHGIGSSCREMRLDDVVVEGGVVFSATSDPLAPRACTADLAGAATFVVAIDRDALPDAGFTLQLRRDSPVCDSCEAERIEVELP